MLQEQVQSSLNEPFLYYYSALVTDVYDGDTVTCDIDLGFGLIWHKQKIRLYGIDTPEIRTKDLVEKKKGFAARDRLRELVLGKNVTLHTQKDKSGKYGRMLGILLTDIDVNHTLVQEGHAQLYVV